MGLQVVEHMPSAPDRVVSERDTATIIGISIDTLRRLGAEGKGPARVRLSTRRIGYRLSAIYAYLDAMTERAGAAQ